MANDITSTSTHTPFSNEEIPQVNATQWHEMSAAKLEEERYKLQQRLNVAYSLNNPQITKCLEQGIREITGLIQSKLQG